MKYTGTTYRPPIEANTLLLQVTQGCSHNNCGFCTMYKDVKFEIEKIDQIDKDLQEANTAVWISEANLPIKCRCVCIKRSTFKRDI